MGNKILVGGHTLELQLGFLKPVVVLGKEELESAVGGDTEKSTLARVGVPWSQCRQIGILIAICVSLFDGGSVKHVVLLNV